MSGSPRGPALSRLGTYRTDRSYAWNYEHGPVWAGPNPVVPETPPKHFFGREVASRIGISAGLLLNARWIGFYARCGYDILTYKTVRSRQRACHAMPNWLFVDAADAEDLNRSSQAVHAQSRPTSAAYTDWTSTVSFGMPSRDPAVWMADVAQASAALAPRQVLVVSVVASPAAGDTADSIVADFGRLAAMAREAGARGKPTCPAPMWYRRG
jgi:hypothetical protein